MNDFWITLFTCICFFLIFFITITVVILVTYKSELTYFLLISKLIKDIIKLLFSNKKAKSHKSRGQNIKKENTTNYENKSETVEDAEFREIKNR
jgi:hypothetical protein